MNLLGPELVRDLVALIQRAEADDAVQVLVFRSADPDDFIPHVDVTRIDAYRAEAPKLTGDPSIALLFHHLSASRLVTIAQIEGRVRGAGSEFVLACDMRFAARESAIFGQPEAAFGLLPGGGAAQHLTRLMGCGRAFESWSRTGSMRSRSRRRATSTAISNLFGEGVRDPGAQSRIGAAMQRGFQAREAERDLARMLGDLAAG